MVSFLDYVYTEVIKNQSKLLFVSDPKLLGGKNKTFLQKVVVGLSCLLYALPSLYARTHGYHYFAASYALITITSFFSDTSFFYHIVNDKYLGLITICDRWAASTGVILNVYLIFKEFARNFVSFHLVIEVFIILIALKVFSISRDSSRRGVWGWQWCFYHTLWHLITVPGAVYGIYVDNLNYA